jgi:hypothetical protein
MLPDELFFSQSPGEIKRGKTEWGRKTGETKLCVGFWFWTLNSSFYSWLPSAEACKSPICQLLLAVLCQHRVIQGDCEAEVDEETCFFVGLLVAWSSCQPHLKTFFHFGSIKTFMIWQENAFCSAHLYLQSHLLWMGMAAKACNPSYSGGGDWEDPGSSLAQTKC